MKTCPFCAELMTLIPFLGVLLIAAPVFGQSRVYTNDDLGKPLALTVTIASSPEGALETWLTHTGGEPPPIVVLSPWEGPTWIEGPSSDWTATLTPNAPLAPDDGVCYGCYGIGYGRGILRAERRWSSRSLTRGGFTPFHDAPRARPASPSHPPDRTQRSASPRAPSAGPIHPDQSVRMRPAAAGTRGPGDENAHRRPR